MKIYKSIKTRFFYIAICLAVLLISACQKHNFTAGELSPTIAVGDLRVLYKGADVTLTKEKLLGATQIVGTVISMPDSGNVPSGIVVMQNYRRGVLRGISFSLGNAASAYHSGDSLVINVVGTTLKRVNGSLQISGLSETAIKKVSENNHVTVQSASSYSIKNNPDQYESTLVQIKMATVSPAPNIDDTFAGDRYLVNGADSIMLHTEASASFANAKLPASATVAGILLIGKNNQGETALQLWPRGISDVSDITKPADPNASLGKSPVIVTGYINDTKGADGNYEYFQFRATRDIDFSKTPMAVVSCTNAGAAEPNKGDAPGAGWATGGGRTYKFNLTEGSVLKGEFFYVGGSNKRINGPNTTDISTAKWIRSIAYVTNDGDGFGSATAGLLPNSGNAGGVAIFDGVIVTETSVPVDAVLFGGTGVTTIYNATTNKGYRVADNDHYNALDGSTAQPFFYQGTNTYVIPHSTPADAGFFVKLGGNFDATSKTWLTPRGFKLYQLQPTSSLSDIETGADVNVMSN
ncbi:DUF5689 domain-containing protein [Mucilaginibacter aquariorum]|uniref:DUF5689 domain-containing protein n=1 Tax=Mucilaginibacter aquariorum TaxID=2967225 RepID=A0ABT1T324_9SPHI|nr:DUF5689 domain-containing protein [Mucilaginibacter aquariorum]MCQ6958671.1 DUF5689 domain-containing protein [Mucilaginibacter aquariorum]